MAARFRYLDETGREVEIPDLDALREAVRSGAVAPDTLLWDAGTGEWAPAQVHSVYRELDEVDLPEPGPEGPSPDEVDFDIPDLDVTLAPEHQVESAEEAIEKLLREREREEGRPPPLAMEGGLVLDETPGRASGAASATPPSGARAEAPRTGPEPAPADRRPDRARPGDWPIREEPRRRPAPRAAPAPPPPRARTPWRALITGGIVAVILASVGYMLTGRPAASAPSGATPTPPPEAPPDEGAPAPWAVVEGGALQDMIEGVDSLRSVFDVERIPPAWLDGRYLADADEYPEVEAYWERYKGFVDAVQEQDTALFRRSFVGRLQDQEMSGPMISIRLARALETFEASQPARDTVYQRMDALADASLDLHELLVARTDEIEYDPVTETRASRQPILEAWSDDPYLRETIWSLLDRITEQLAFLEGNDADARSDLTERLFQELRRRTGG